MRRRRTGRPPIALQGGSLGGGVVVADPAGRPSAIPFEAFTTAIGAGDVAGPASSTDNGIARFDGTTGKLLQNTSGPTMPDSGRISNVTDPTSAQDAATKAYVDAAATALLAVTSDPGSPVDKQWWLFLDAGTPENLSLRIRRGGVTYDIPIGTLI